MRAVHPVSMVRVAGAALSIAMWPALMFVLAGDARWLAGWAFAAWFLGLCATVIAWLWRKDPALLAERFRRPGSGGQQSDDQLVVYGLAAGFAAWIALMPLDARRFGWTPAPPVALRAVGAALLAVSALLLFRSFRDNTFLSPLVRVQSERRQRVVSSGVYAFVRHPMYLGAVLMFVGAPILLGSALGLAVAAAMTLLLGFRIIIEERVLVRELDGYAEYRNAVRYRLIPRLW
jgi:protein-S-isoprenylcysteine O-methyltransferase Ste14